MTHVASHSFGASWRYRLNSGPEAIYVRVELARIKKRQVSTDCEVAESEDEDEVWFAE